MKRDNFFIVFFGILLVLSISMILLQSIGMTGYVTEGSAVSNVTITSYLAIQMSSNLGEGILFGTINELPGTNVNATHNHDGGSSGSTMYIEVSNDSNSNVDLCIKANEDLMSQELEIIGVGNQTYANSTTTDAGTPAVASEVSLTKSYVKSGVDIEKGSNFYYRFWLDIPAAQPVGTYNNTVYFKGVITGGNCE
ncbi:MAG: hypothetical protein WC494_00690 [Candidatus Pacearchaeota archaeon]